MRRYILLRSVRLLPISNNTLTIRTFLFSPRSLSTSTRMHGEFLRLLFLQAHRETEAHFIATNSTGMSSQNINPEALRFKRAAFYNGLKSKVGLAAAKAAALRVNLNDQGCSIVAPPIHAPWKDLKDDDVVGVVQKNAPSPWGYAHTVVCMCLAKDTGDKAAAAQADAMVGGSRLDLLIETFNALRAAQDAIRAEWEEKEKLRPLSQERTIQSVAAAEGDAVGG